MKKNDYTSYPEGYRRLQRDMIPFYLRPLKKTLMRLLLVILADN